MSRHSRGGEGRELYSEDETPNGSETSLLSWKRGYSRKKQRLFWSQGPDISIAPASHKKNTANAVLKRIIV